MNVNGDVNVNVNVGVYANVNVDTDVNVPAMWPVSEPTAQPSKERPTLVAPQWTTARSSGAKGSIPRRSRNSSSYPSRI